MDDAYKRQVSLLLSVLPEVAKEPCFAMHGGTAINLFVRDMPRLSVDVDLTYVPLEDRQTTISGINQALARVKGRVEALNLGIHIQHKEDVCKLQISRSGVQIKIEVNTVIRGLLNDPVTAELCVPAQEQFDAFCAISLVPISQIYGGKICAALDRQHPRDLFDIKLLLENEGFSEDIKRGFIFGLLSSDRPIYELLRPHRLDQRAAFEHQFEGMSALSFTYDDFEETRERLLNEIHQNLTDQDKQFLLNVTDLEPDWSIYDFARFPSVQWKLQNLERLRGMNRDKFEQQYKELDSVLHGE